MLKISLLQKEVQDKKFSFGCKGLFTPKNLGSNPSTQVVPCSLDETIVSGVPCFKQGT